MIGSIMEGASSLINTGMGIYDRIQASQISDTRPTMDVPDSQKIALARSARAANTSVRDREDYKLQKGLIEGNIAAGADSIKSMGGGGAGMGAIVDMFGQGQKGLTQAAIGATQTRRQDEALYQNQLGKTAGYEQDAWDWNQKGEYNDRMQEKGYLEERGMENIMGGIQGLTNAATGLEGEYDAKTLNAEKEKRRKAQLGEGL